MADYDDTADADAAGADTPSEADAEILKDARDFLQARIDAESDMRTEALDDLRFLVGEQWPEDVAAARRADNRPCITINKLPAALRQITNDQRQNRSSIKVHPVDSGADVEVADILQGLVKHIEYDSNADVACDTAVNSAASIGFGYWRLVTEYCSADSFDQDIKFKRIRNPFSVYLGPHTEPDASDMMKALITEELEKAEFKRQFPKADCDDSLERGVGDGLKTWLSKDKVRIAEFYRVECTPEKLYRLIDGTNVLEDDLPEGAEFQLGKDGEPMTRTSERRKVWWYKISGVEVLERSEIMCYWIPLFPVYGDEFDVDGKIYRSGMIRPSKGPTQMYNVYMTAATEEIGLRPKVPFIGAVGQFDTDKKWANANTRSYPFMEYDPVTVDGTIAPPPQRQPMADVPSGMIQMAMHASDDVKSVQGLFNASLGQQGNETSGRAILARQKEGDVGSFHYQDNLNRSKRQCSRCILWMVPNYYDTERLLRIMGEDETVKQVVVNQQVPQEQQRPDPKTGAIKTVLNDLRVGKYDVVVNTGPSYTTQRQEEADALIQLGQSFPQLYAAAGDLVVKSFDWHNADKIAERIKRTIPPEIVGPDDEENQEPIPAQAQQQIAQLSQAKDQLEHALQAAHEEHQQLEMQVKSGERGKMIDAQTSQQVEQAKNTREAAKQHADDMRERVKIEMDREIEERKLEHAREMKQIEIDAAERLKQISIDGAREQAITVAAINARAKVEAAELQASQTPSTLTPEQGNAAAEGTKMDSVMQALQSVVEHLSAPVELVKGPDGKTIGARRSVKPK